MTKYILGFLTFIIFGVLLILLFSSNGILSKKATTTLGSQKIVLEVAKTQKSREKGLSGRRTLAENQGMLFIFDKASFPVFWMKGMKFPIDIIFLKENQIVTIYKNVPAPKNINETPMLYYQPTTLSDKVIELKSGSADKYNLRIGDTIKISL